MGESQEIGVAVALAELKGAVDTGFARIDGRLDGQLQRTDSMEETVKELRARVALLERKVWLAAGLAAGGGGGIAAAIASALGG